MEVVYDIAYLGAAAEYGGGCETGVGRVCRNLLSGLQDRPELSLTLSSFEHPYGGRIYARDHGLDRRLPAPSSAAAAALNWMLPALHRRWQLGKPEIGHAPLPWKKRFRRGIWHRLARLPFPATNRRQLAAADIFHSSHYPLPISPAIGPRPRRFLTICDVIPLLRPDLFAEGINRFFRRIAASVDAATWIIAISESTKRDVCSQLGLPAEQVFVAPLAAEETIFHPCPDPAQLVAVRRRYGIGDSPYLLSLCTLEPRKNLTSLVRAFCYLVRQERIEDLSLVLIGAPGWMPERLEAALEAAGELRPRILLTGYVPDHELSPLYSGALAFAYLSEYEGFGLPPLEAMQCGVPVITSSTSSLPEVVGDAGLLCPPKDLAGQTDALRRIYREPELRAEMIRRGLVRAAGFSWDRCVSCVVDAYTASMRQTRATPPQRRHENLRVSTQPQ